MHGSTWRFRFLFSMFGSLLLLAPFLLLDYRTVFAQGDPGTIAYVRPNNAIGDEIRLIAPDGSNDRRIWHVDQADPHEVKEIGSLAWRPDASELAFISNHESSLCSIYDSDIYSIRPDGSGYRRITNAPACDEFKNYPKGTVQIEVENQGMFGGTFWVYFQGAANGQLTGIASGQIETVTFPDVADFGPNTLQFATAINAQNVSRRSWGAPVDVQTGNTVKARLLLTNDDALPEFGAKQPTWRSDGSKIGYVLSLGAIDQIDPNPAPPALGEPLLAAGAGTTTVNQLAWSPVPTMANQLLYAGSDSDGTGIYRILEGGQGLGEQLVSADSWESVLGLAWLPDGSGFVYAITESYDESAGILDESANLFVYHFASGEATRLTSFNGEFARKLSVSPDGQQIVFERATALWYAPWEEPKVDLWLMDRDGSTLQLLIQNGYAPAWSSTEPPAPTDPDPTGPGDPTAPGTPDPRLYFPYILPMQAVMQRAGELYAGWREGLGAWLALASSEAALQLQ
jgi:hypothetical protein